jgi:hypothetical protein
MATDVDIERVGFPVHDGHCHARFVGKLDFCLLSRYTIDPVFIDFCGPCTF